MLEPEDVFPGMPLRAFTAEDYKAVIRAAREAMEPKVAAPLEWVGDTIGLSRPEGFYATLSGASSPYSFTEKYGTTGGAWATRVRTGTANAYEVNGLAGLSGKTVFLRPGYPGEYLFQSSSVGSTGCSTGTLVFTVTGCGVNQAGATVTVTGPGGFSASGTTNGSGQVTFSVVGYPAGTYSWTVSKGVRFQSQSGTKSVVCATTNTQIVSLSAATGYRCASCCGVPIKENLWLTTPFGTTIAFNFVASQWQGTAVESISCRKDAGCATSSTEDCSFFYSMLGSGCSPVGTSGSGGTGSGGYDITTSPPTMICDAANTCTNRAVQVIVLGNTITCEPFTTTGTARFVYNPSTGVTNDYGTISVTE